MSDQRKKRRNGEDSTTDFFLNFIKDEKSQEKKEKKKKEDIETTRKQAVGILARAYNSVNKVLDIILNNKYSGRIIALILTVILFFTYSGGQIMQTATSGTTLKNVEIKVEGLSDNYDVGGLPDTVTIGLIGPSLDIYATRLADDYEVYVDLSEYKEGSYQVPIKTRNFDSDLTVMVLPETANITISPKVEATFDVTPYFINEDTLDQTYSVSVDSLSANKVKVYASQRRINRIVEIRATVDVKDETKSFTQTCTLKAYNSHGQQVACTISPETVEVTCHIDSYSKTVAIKPNFKGSLKKGYKMKNYTLSSSTVTIYGNKSDISKISSIECDVDISGLSGSTKLTGLELKKNDKINKMSIDKIDIEMTIE